MVLEVGGVGDTDLDCLLSVASTVLGKLSIVGW